jgi:AraC-like DNA-binding protein
MARPESARPESARPRDNCAAVFSTNDVTERERTDYWNGVTARYFGPLETRATGRAAFSATLATRPVSFLRTYYIVGSGHKAQRSKSNAGILPDCIKLLLQVRGRCRVDQEGRTAELRPGAWCVYDSWRPYSLANSGDVEQIVVQIPREQIFDRSLARLTEPFLADPAQSSMAYVTASFIRSYAAPGLVPDDGDEFLAETTIGLVRRVLHANLSLRRSAQAPSSVLRTRIKQYILAHLNDPDLSIDRIAAAMGCSKRYLHQVFAAECVTIERHIWRLRIEHCCLALAEHGQSEKSISEIAFEWGFNSSAHFSRLFKSEVGVAPTSYRRSLMAGSPAAAGERIGLFA